MTSTILNLQSLGKLTDDAFIQLCRDNPHLEIERTVDGLLILIESHHSSQRQGLENDGVPSQLVTTNADNSPILVSPW